MQGRKKKVSLGSESSEWPEQRVKFLVVIKKLFKLPISKLWDPPAVDPEFVKYEFFHFRFNLFKCFRTVYLKYL